MKNYKYKVEQSLSITTSSSLVIVTVNNNNITLEVNSSSMGITRIVISFSSRLLSVTVQKTSEFQITRQISINVYLGNGSLTIAITFCSNSVAFGKPIFSVVYETKYIEPSFIRQWFQIRNKDPPNLMFYRLI